MIRHTAVFRLRHAVGSSSESAFLAAIRALKAIPGVNVFEVLRQVSPKNDFTFAVSMEFADDKAYQGYNNHPAHVVFVRDRWVPEVAAFMEIDYVVLPE